MRVTGGRVKTRHVEIKRAAKSKPKVVSMRCKHDRVAMGVTVFKNCVNCGSVFPGFNGVTTIRESACSGECFVMYSMRQSVLRESRRKTRESRRSRYQRAARVQECEHAGLSGAGLESLRPCVIAEEEHAEEEHAEEAELIYSSSQGFTSDFTDEVDDCFSDGSTDSEGFQRVGEVFIDEVQVRSPKPEHAGLISVILTTT